jgi:hypothetical protein
MKHRYKHVVVLFVFLFSLSLLTKGYEIVCQDRIDCYKQLFYHYEMIKKAMLEIMRHSSYVSNLFDGCFIYCNFSESFQFCNRSNPPNYSQIVRWTNKKEFHASEIQRILSSVLASTRPVLDKQHQPTKQYTDLLVTYHRILYLAQEAIETTDLNVLIELQDILKKLFIVDDDKTSPMDYTSDGLKREADSNSQSDEFEELVQELLEVFPQLNKPHNGPLGDNDENEVPSLHCLFFLLLFMLSQSTFNFLTKIEIFLMVNLL